MDCHNRPAHSYDLPDRGVDKAMTAGLISATLPHRHGSAKGNPAQAKASRRILRGAGARRVRLSRAAASAKRIQVNGAEKSTLRKTPLRQEIFPSRGFRIEFPESALTASDLRRQQE